jgi:hypothetical protein
MHFTSRPLAKDEPLPRDDFLSWAKLAAKGAPTKTPTIILSWLPNTQLLLFSLPTKKYQALHVDIQHATNKRNISHKQLGSLIGRLQNATTIIPTSSYFLNRLRGLEQPDFNSWYNYKLSGAILTDLTLWLEFLKESHLGLSLDLLMILWQPTHLCYSDSCPAGLGGFVST